MAGGTKVGSLYASLTLEDQSFYVALKKAGAETEKSVARIQGQLSSLIGGFKALGAFVIGSEFIGAAKRALDYASSLGEVSQQLGVTTRDLQVFRYIGSQVGVEQDAMDASLQKLTRSIGDAAVGSKKQASAFRDLGVAVQDSNGKLYTAGDVLPKLADAFAKIESPATRARYEVALFGKAGQQLDPLLTQGSKGVEAMADEAQRLGLIMGDALIQKADAAADRLTALTKVLEINLATAVAEGADGIYAFADAFISLIAKIGDAISWLKSFGHEARQAVNRAKGWTPFGEPVSGDAGTRARMAYFGEAVGWDEQQRQRNAKVNAGRTAIIRDGALPTPAGGGRTKRERKPPKDRTEQYLERYQRELGQMLNEELRLRADAATNLEERAQLESQRLDNERTQYEREVDDRQKDGELTAAQAQELKLRNAANLALQQQQVWNERDAALAQETLTKAQAQLDLRQDALRSELDGARTQEDRRRIELELLDTEMERQRAADELVLALWRAGKATNEEATAAENRLKALPAIREARAGSIRRDTMGPLDAYLDSLPQSIDEVNEAFQRAEVEGLQGFRDGLKDVLLHGGNVFDALSAGVDRFIDKLADLAIDEVFQSLMGKGGGGGFFSSIGNAFGSVFGLGKGGGGGGLGAIKDLSNIKSIPGLASGGHFMAGGVPGIDRNVLSINGIARARVSANERISVTPANDQGPGGGPPMVFDLRGAVLTADLLDQMNTIATSTSGKMIGSFAKSRARAARSTLD